MNARRLFRSRVLVYSLTGVTLLLCSATGPNQSGVTGPKAKAKDLYLHWFTPVYHLDGGAQQPKRILSLRVYPGQGITVILEEGNPSLKGRVDNRDGEYQVELEAAYANSTGFFRGRSNWARSFSRASTPSVRSL